MSLNDIAIMGRLTADPELRMTPNDVPVCTIRLAVDRDVKGKDGRKETDFIDVVCWRKTAEFVANFMSKGRQVVVKGRLQVRDYIDKEDCKRQKAEVVADNVYFADSKYDMPHNQSNLPEVDEEVPF